MKSQEIIMGTKCGKIKFILGSILISFFSALLGWFFSTPFSYESIFPFVLIILGIVSGAILIAWD